MAAAKRRCSSGACNARRSAANTGLPATVCSARKKPVRAPSSECRAVLVPKCVRRKEEQVPAHWRSTRSSTPGLQPPTRACTGGAALGEATHR